MPTLREVLERLGIPDVEARSAAVLAEAEREGAPWFVRLFVGCGTWVGAAILTSFLAAADLFDDRARALGLGGVLLAGALTALPLAHRFPAGVNLAAAALAAAVVLLWLHESRLRASRWGGPWTALAHGLAVGLAIPLTVLLVRELTDVGWLLGGSSTRLGAFLALPTWVTVALALLAAWVIAVAFAEQGHSLAGREGILALAGLALLTALTLQVPGLLAGLLLLVLSHLRGDRALHVLALLYVAGFLFAFYYQLHVPLLTKSLWMLAAGTLLLVLYALLRRAGEPGEEPAAASPLHPARRRALAGLALALTLALALPAYAIWSKERVLASGRTVLLHLAPVDPRSLIQGDYMALRYAIGQEIPSLEGIPRTGRLVLRLAPTGAATFARLHRGGDLAPGEQLLRYRVRSTGWRQELRLGAESYFFEEGTADRYAKAAYGELKVGRDGEPVLVGLRDDRLRPLGKRLH